MPAITHNGVRYYLSPANPHYRSFPTRKDKRSRILHRVLWEEAFGPIPARYDVHHKDGDPTNNTLANLDLMLRNEHRRLHNAPQARRAHQSLVMKDWIRRARTIRKRCSWCDDPFLALPYQKFCSYDCRQKALIAGRKGAAKCR